MRPNSNSPLVGKSACSSRNCCPKATHRKMNASCFWWERWPGVFCEKLVNHCKAFTAGPFQLFIPPEAPNQKICCQNPTCFSGQHHLTVILGCSPMRMCHGSCVFSFMG